MKKRLLRQMKKLLKKADRYDTIVLCEDGKETENNYPVWCMYEPDTKSPEDWINSIFFFQKLQKKDTTLSLKLKTN